MKMKNIFLSQERANITATAYRVMKVKGLSKSAAFKDAWADAKSSHGTWTKSKNRNRF